VLGTIIVIVCAAAFLYRNWPRSSEAEAQRAAPLHDAYVLMLNDKSDQAIELLDSVDTRRLDSSALASWLNIKANALALVGRSDEALELLDDLHSLADANDAVTQLCLVGNRGLAHLFAGRLELASQLLDDTETAAHALAATHPHHGAESHLAETWWWRAEIARRQGDQARQRECLQHAAAAGRYPYAVKAKHALQNL
jgi:ATP/maltotriose-dependent transcriptional regulator MalT